MEVVSEQTWKVSLCDCCHDWRVCCFGFCCCCCLYGQTMANIDQGTHWWQHSCQYGLCSLFGCWWLLHGFTRSQLRERYGLAENRCGDCCITCCCPFCAVCQEAQEIQVRGYPPPPRIIIHPPALSISTGSALD